MKKKYLLGGVCIVLGLSVALGLGIFAKYQKQKAGEDYEVVVLDDYVIIGEEQEEVPLDGETLTTDESNLVLAEMLGYVPANLLNMFYADNWGFALTTESLSDKFFQGKYNYVRAVTDSQMKTIWLAQNEAAIRQSAIHEMGHYLDIKLGRPNKSADFNRIWRDERVNFVVVNGDPNQAKQSCSEYFAEAFQETILHPDSMRQNTPRTYEYMVALISQYQ